MTARQWGLATVLIGVAIAAVLIHIPSAQAQGMLKIQPIAVFQNEGRDPIYFSTTCVSSSWNLALSSDTIVRSTYIIAPSSNTSVVCLSTGPTNANACSASTIGDEIQPGGNETLYHHAAIYCRAGAGSQVLKGHRTRDHGDYGQAPIP